MSSQNVKTQRILVIRYRFIGDTVLAIPFLRNLRMAYPNAIIDVLVEPISGETLKHCPYINELLFFAPKLKGNAKKASLYPTSLWDCALMLRRRHYNKAYVLRRSFSSALLAVMAGIPHRIGFAIDGRKWLLSRSVPYHDKHEVECLLDVLLADQIPIVNTYNENWSDPIVDEQVMADLPASKRCRVFICAKSIYLPKDWLPERFADVIRWLITERNCEIHWCDSPANAHYYQTIFNQLSSSQRECCIDWSYKLSIADVPSLFKQIDIAFGIDTGLLHIAASLHIPIVAIFGPLEPWRWHPWDTKYHIVRPSNMSIPMPLTQVKVQQVCDALDTFLVEY